MTSKATKIVLILLIIISFSIGIYGYVLKKDKEKEVPIDNNELVCDYNLGNTNYNSELKNLCESSKIKYTAYTTLDYLNDKDKYYFEDNIAKYFNSEYYTNINEVTAQTKKYLILSYLDFKENSCYSKNLINEVSKNIFTLNNTENEEEIDENENNINLEGVFEPSEIKNNFICVNSINSNSVVKLSLQNNSEFDINELYYLINNNDKVEINIQDKTIKNVNDYNIEELEVNSFKKFNIIENISPYITLINYENIDDDNFIKMNEEYKINDKITIKLDSNNLYINSEQLFKNVDKLILDKKNQRMIVLNKKQIYIIKFSDLNSFNSIDDYKINNYEFSDIYLYDNKFNKIEDLIFETKDKTYYSLEKSNIIDAYSIEKEINVDNTSKYIYKINVNDGSVSTNNEQINDKVKMLLGNYFITDDDYLYSMYENSKLMDSKIKSIYRQTISTNDNNTLYKFFIEFENNEKLMFYDFY